MADRIKVLRPTDMHESKSTPLSDEILPVKLFRRAICSERKRSERSRRSFLLMLIGLKEASPKQVNRDTLARAAVAICKTIRETDVPGWFEDGILGIMFAELGDAQAASARESIEARTWATLAKSLSGIQLANVSVSVYTFPESFNDKDEIHSIDLPIYPDLCEEKQDKRGSFVVKRLMDIIGSASALIALSPVFAALAIAVKATSKGPVFFRQKRVGQHGHSFVFLKFRSMFVANDPSIHRNYVAAFIAGKVQTVESADAAGEIYKITDDPRVTSVGRLMRRLSLDEIPQFWNVLVGEMSLVGPRPPIPYEIDAYDVWHRRRFWEVKPGITGLWQVHGRSKTTFDEMVRLDLRYSKTWSPAVDLKILIQTPKAVFSGEGAY